MDEAKVDSIARRWMEYARAVSVRGGAGSKAVYEQFADMIWLWIDTPAKQPELAWAVILRVQALTDNPAVLELLAASFLEELISEHGGAFIERIERHAASNPQFRALLHTVWADQLPAEIWERIEQARGPRS